MRPQRSLAGSWEFQIDPDDLISIDSLAPDRTIPVPMPWQAVFPELQTYSGFAWYRRAVDLPEDWLTGELLLHFGAVDYWCRVFVNGQLAGEHEGGYTPFTLPIRRLVQPGRNEIAVQVYDSAQTEVVIPRWPDYHREQGPSQPPFDANNVPHGKQEWYINVGGIWQDVTLTAVPATYIQHVRVIPDIHSGQAHITVELAGPTTDQLATGMIRARCLESGGSVAGEAAVAVGATPVHTLTVPVAQPRWWSPEDPYLYTLTVQLAGAGADDAVSLRFGFREITTRDGQILLNGAPIFLLAALDQDLYPETIYTVPSEAFLRDEFQKAKALGLNCLRCHIKPPDPRYLDLADEMGLLVWAEIPSWRTFYPKGTMFPALLDVGEVIKGRVEQTLEEMVRRDCNHPSLIIWTIVNEDWGTALPLSAADRAWVAAMYRRCKALDPTRLVVDNSACPHPWGPNIHVHSDLDDFHMYANIPDQARGFADSIEQFGLRPLWTYSTHGDTERSGQEPLVLSEFGNWGLPSLAGLRTRAGGHDPAWFNIGPWWSPWDGEAGWPAGVAERFAALGLDAIWPDYEAFATATQWHQYAAMKFEIETMRRQPTLAGYVITEFTDAYWESNGLLDFDRQPKAYDDRFATINTPDVIIPQAQRYAYWDDQVAQARLHVSHYSAADWEGARLRWGVDGSEGTVSPPLPSVPRGGVATLGTVAAALPPVDTARIVPLRFALERPAAPPLARNQLDLLVLPAAARQPGFTGSLAVLARPAAFAAGAPEALPLPPEALDEPFGPPQLSGETPAEADAPLDDVPVGLGRALQRLGYRTTGHLTPDTQVAVATYPTAALLQWVREGGDLLFLAQGPSPFFWVGGRGGAYSGGWITSFSWLRPAVHRRLGAHNPLSLPFQPVMPRGTILGLPMEDRAVQGDFLAGMISGWVRHPAVHTVQFRYGRGRVVMTTFGLDSALDDPVGVALFHDLIDHLHSDACRPVLTASY
jgi:hypothetical protein